MSGAFPSTHSNLSLGHCLVPSDSSGCLLGLLAPSPHSPTFPLVACVSASRVCVQKCPIFKLRDIFTYECAGPYSYLSWERCRLQVRPCWGEREFFLVFFLFTHVNLDRDPTSLQFIHWTFIPAGHVFQPRCLCPSLKVIGCSSLSP